jgi:hypothetical protein
VTDELAAETTRKLLKIMAMTALGGAALRGGASILRNTNPRYEPPEVPKPVVVDMPYPAPAAPPTSALPLPGREKKVKLAAYPSWTKFPGGETIHDLLPTYTPPLGNTGETDPKNVPVYGALQAGVGAAGGVGGYFLADKLLRAADRWRARRDLDSAKKEYHQSVVDRLAGTKLASKSAATDEPTPEAARAKAAIDRLYAAVKAAAPVPNPDPDPVSRTTASLLWPGLATGNPDLARLNMFVAGAAGLGGGILGYQKFRDKEKSEATRRQIRAVDRANAEGLPSPIIARLVPVPPTA